MKRDPTDPLVLRWLGACGAALVVLAVAVLVGRFTGRLWLVRVVPEGPPMAFLTAVSLLLAGAAMLAQCAGWRRTARLAALAMMALGGGTLAVYVLAEPLGWTRFIYDPARPVLSRGVGFDGRMSPNVAFTTALLGAALLLLGARRLHARAAVAVTTVLLAVPLLAATSYLAGLRLAAPWWRFASMAVHTMAAFLVAGSLMVWWLMRRMTAADRGVTRTLPFFISSAAVVLVLGGLVLVSNDQRQQAALAMNHTLEVDAAVERFIAAMARMEAAARNFALTGDERYIERIQVHRASTRAAAEALGALTRDHPPQHQQALGLAPLLARKYAVNDDLVRARRERGAEAAAQALRAEPPDLMPALRAATDDLQLEGQRTLRRARDQAATSETRLNWLLIVGALVTVGLVVTTFSLVQRAQGALQQANDQLERRVRERTAALEASTARLSESERRLRFLADTLPQLVWTARPDGTIESLNHGYIVYLGKDNEADAIAAIYGVVHPDDQAESAREWAAMLREQRAAGGELRLRRHDGVYRWHLWRAHPERDASGAIVRWVGTSTDIHDKKLAEAQLEQRVAVRTTELATSEERFRQAFDFAGIGMALVAIDGRWLRVNKSICEIVGYSEEELLRKTFQDITHPDDLAGDLANVHALLDGRMRFYQMEKRYFHRDGHTVWVRLTVSLVHDAAQQPVHFISQIEDITERKRLEESLARARDQALEASRLKSEFLATMSHEIRTPMNGVVGMTALLRDTPLTPTQADFVRTIESSGESLLTIINDILDYSKIEAGRIELEESPFDLRQCVADAIDLFSARATAKGLALHARIASDVPRRVRGDATRLRQILVNLVGNAIKFTERGTVVVEAACEPQLGSAAKQRLSFAVCDTGIGIPPEGMGRLFKSFSQVDASTTRRFGGTGLGLAISKRLAELMGGTMTAESRVGEGSTFRFAVLLEPLAALPADDERASPAAPDATLGRRCPLKLLVVEDNPVNQRVASLLLQRLGYRTTIVGNGLEALTAASEADYDVILMDVEMPELDGCEATRRIRGHRRTAARPWIIALTAGAMQGDRERALAAGMNDFLTKPVRPDELSAALIRAHASVTRHAGAA